MNEKMEKNLEELEAVAENNVKVVEEIEEVVTEKKLFGKIKKSTAIKVGIGAAAVLGVAYLVSKYGGEDYIEEIVETAGEVVGE